MAAVPRHDLTVTFARFTVEIGKYSDDGLNILINNGWLEEPHNPREEILLIKDSKLKSLLQSDCKSIRKENEAHVINLPLPSP